MTSAPCGPSKGTAGYVMAVAVTPGGRRAVFGSSDNTLKVWDLKSGRVLQTLEGHADSVFGMTRARTDRALAFTQWTQSEQNLANVRRSARGTFAPSASEQPGVLKGFPCGTSERVRRSGVGQ
jgi:WD40 repeat protein